MFVVLVKQKELPKNDVLEGRLRKMKYTKCCPKCSSNDVARVPGRSQGYGYGNNIPTGIINQTLVAKYVCCNCGFNEDWVDEPHNIAKIKNHYLKPDKQPVSTNKRNTKLVR